MLHDRIGRPINAHGVRSPDEYRAYARRMLDELNARFGLNLAVAVREGRPPALINAGRWLVVCPCGNAPSADPDWGLAICLECGSEFRPVFPSDVAGIETALLDRTKSPQRNWNPGETAEDIRQQNVAEYWAQKMGV